MSADNLLLGISAEVWTAIFTFALTVSTIFLWLTTRNLVKGGEDTTLRQLRAYISITPKSVFNWRNSTKDIIVSILIKNHGKTPGFGVSYQFSMVILNKVFPDNFVWPKPDRHFNQDGTLFPDEVLPVRFPAFGRSLTDTEIKEIALGERRFYVHGIMQYRDAFKQTRTTKFAFSFGGPHFDMAMHNIPGSSWDWEYNQGHNDAT